MRPMLAVDNRAPAMLALLLGLAVAGPSSAADLLLTLDRASIIAVPNGTSTIVIGNPTFADISFPKSGNVAVITGKSAGTTNMIALDAQGKPIVELILKVTDGSAGTVTVFKGGDRETYACNPACSPTVAIGDDRPFFNRQEAQITARNGLATQKAP